MLLLFLRRRLPRPSLAQVHNIANITSGSHVEDDQERMSNVEEIERREESEAKECVGVQCVAVIRRRVRKANIR